VLILQLYHKIMLIQDIIKQIWLALGLNRGVRSILGHLICVITRARGHLLEFHILFVNASSYRYNFSNFS